MKPESKQELLSRLETTLHLELVNLQYGIDGTNAEGQQVSEEFALKSRAVATRAIFLTWKVASSLPISVELKARVEANLTQYLNEARLFFENNMSDVDYTW